MYQLFRVIHHLHKAHISSAWNKNNIDSVPIAITFVRMPQLIVISSVFSKMKHDLPHLLDGLPRVK
jgi:hypothetical protein